MAAGAKQSESLQRARLVLPLFLLGLVIAGIGFALRGRGPQEASAASVRGEIAAIVEKQSYLGPFLLQAESFDAGRCEFTNFHAETDELMVAARRATLDVNTSTDTISFILYDVTIVRVPDASHDDLPVVTRDTYILGPIPYNRDIIEDEEPPGSSVLPE